MKQIEEHKATVLKFFKCISGKKKNSKLVSKFSDDPSLIDHVLYFETLMPSFTILIDEITAEGSRVCVRVRYKGAQKEKINGNSPTNKEIEFSLVIGYQISSGLIVDHWTIADQMSLMEQLDHG